MTYFDLAKISLERSASSHSLRVARSVLLVVFAAMLVGLGAELGLRAELSQPTGFLDLVIAVLEAGFSFAIGLGAVALWKSGKGAIGVGVDSEGVHFHWATGREDFFRRAETEGKLSLLDYTSDRGTKGLNPMSSWEAHGWSRTPSQISKEAFDEIFRAAENNGVRTTRVFQTSPTWWPPCYEIRFETTRRIQGHGSTIADVEH